MLRGKFPTEWCSLTKLGSQISLFPVPIFGVNKTKAWKDKNVVRKDIKTGNLVLKRKKNWENPGKLYESWEGSYIAKETEMPGGFVC
jgi:hypothetical protein